MSHMTDPRMVSSTASAPAAAPAPQHHGVPQRGVIPVMAVPQGQGHFVHKLYAMLENTTITHLLQWSPDGLSFMVLRPNEFSKVVLPSYFKHSNFTSFIRQLNIYGFSLVTRIPARAVPIAGGLTGSDPRLHSSTSPEAPAPPNGAAEPAARTDDEASASQPAIREADTAVSAAQAAAASASATADANSNVAASGETPTMEQIWVFRHPLFQRGQPDLLAQIKRKQSTKNAGGAGAGWRGDGADHASPSAGNLHAFAASPAMSGIQSPPSVTHHHAASPYAQSLHGFDGQQHFSQPPHLAQRYPPQQAPSSYSEHHLSDPVRTNQQRPGLLPSGGAGPRYPLNGEPTPSSRPGATSAPQPPSHMSPDWSSHPVPQQYTGRAPNGDYSPQVPSYSASSFQDARQAGNDASYSQQRSDTSPAPPLGAAPAIDPLALTRIAAAVARLSTLLTRIATPGTSEHVESAALAHEAITVARLLGADKQGVPIPGPQQAQGSLLRELRDHSDRRVEPANVARERDRDRLPRPAMSDPSMRRHADPDVAHGQGDQPLFYSPRPSDFNDFTPSYDHQHHRHRDQAHEQHSAQTYPRSHIPSPRMSSRGGSGSAEHTARQRRSSIGPSSLSKSASPPHDPHQHHHSRQPVNPDDTPRTAMARAFPPPVVNIVNGVGMDNHPDLHGQEKSASPDDD
uniref:Predicted protein n=1 Tax=Hordeum vulgare subsp. vulgare TaxID=112509 RepID=F2E2Z5_HORVV|nr:predicted protein [Hordeum vulgare subsp. vulgare]